MARLQTEVEDSSSCPEFGILELAASLNLVNSADVCNHNQGQSNGIKWVSLAVSGGNTMINHG